MSCKVEALQTDSPAPIFKMLYEVRNSVFSAFGIEIVRPFTSSHTQHINQPQLEVLCQWLDTLKVGGTTRCKAVYDD